MELVLASGNKKKRAELEALLEPLGIRLLTPEDVGGLPEVVEDRSTFAGNADKKAVSAASATQRWALADDSGLEVDHLAGAPGVRSARYAGEPANDANNNAKLLDALSGVPETDRGARFVCSLSLANPKGEVVARFSGTVRGRILEAPRGGSGFGYDPLFRFDEEGQPGFGKAFAELSADEKSSISHRGRALHALSERLPHLMSAATTGD